MGQLDITTISEKIFFPIIEMIILLYTKKITPFFFFFFGFHQLISLCKDKYDVQGLGGRQSLLQCYSAQELEQRLELQCPLYYPSALFTGTNSQVVGAEWHKK